MPLYQAIILAVVQGMTELLPVSSSAHVIVVAELFRQNMSTPANALLLVMLHTGTMFAVVIYFWKRWRRDFLSSWTGFYAYAKLIFVSCLCSGIVGLPIILLVEHILSHGQHHAEIEALFHKLNWIAPALAAVGILILYAGLREARKPQSLSEGRSAEGDGSKALSWRSVLFIGIAQGIAIPFRGFSRSGSTISAGLLTGADRAPVESFSFAIGVAITPLAIARELYRLLHSVHHSGAPLSLGAALAPSMVGMVFAFLAGLLALKWLSRWLEQGRWYWFAIYCLIAAVGVQILYLRGW